MEAAHPCHHVGVRSMGAWIGGGFMLHAADAKAEGPGNDIAVSVATLNAGIEFFAADIRPEKLRLQGSPRAKHVVLAVGLERRDEYHDEAHSDKTSADGADGYCISNYISGHRGIAKPF